MNRRYLGYLLIGFAAILILNDTSVHADPIVYDSSALGELNGSRSWTLGGLSNDLAFGGGSSMLKEASIEWIISPTTEGFKYSYTFEYTYDAEARGGKQDISHFILDLSDDCEEGSGCVTAFLSNQDDESDKQVVFVYDTFTTEGNPNFSGEITGIKFENLDVGEGTGYFWFSFESTRPPVYGDFYAKGGNGDENGFAIYNVGALDHDSTDVRDFIARPNGETVTHVPEPTSLLLLGTGLGIAGLLVRNRRK